MAKIHSMKKIEQFLIRRLIRAGTDKKSKFFIRLA